MISSPILSRLWLFFSALAFALSAGPVAANDLPEGALPDAVVAGPKHNFKRAWLAQPTDRYGHAILGDGIEAGSLVIETTCRHRVEHVLDDQHVFEDRHVRIADLDGDIYAEAVVVLSNANLGAALAVYGIKGGSCSVAGELTLKARTPFIGTRNRWLNPAGIADYDGDGTPEIAIVVTPHIGGTLQFWSLAGDKLVLKAQKFGFSNHAIGARDQRLSTTLKVQGKTLLLVPGAARKTLQLVELSDGKIKSRKVADLGFRVRENFTAEVKGSTEAVVTFSNGKRIKIALD